MALDDIAAPLARRLWRTDLVCAGLSNISAKLDTLIADEHGRPGDKIPDFIIALTAE